MLELVLVREKFCLILLFLIFSVYSTRNIQLFIKTENADLNIERAASLRVGEKEIESLKLSK